MFVFFEKIAESFASKAELKQQLLHNKAVARHFPKKHVFLLTRVVSADNNKTKT